MAYRIAVASSDGVNVDLHFGAAESFLIYAVDDEGKFSFEEKRALPKEAEPAGKALDCEANSQGQGACSGASGGCSKGGGCGHGQGASGKVEAISDCRSVVAAKIGFNVQKQLERKAISGFDVECSAEEALQKITKYFYKLDNHISLKKRAGF